MMKATLRIGRAETCISGAPMRFENEQRVLLQFFLPVFLLNVVLSWNLCHIGRQLGLYLLFKKALCSLVNILGY